MWYVIRTIAGQEEELVSMVRKLISSRYYEDCFSLKRECIKKTEEGCQTYLAPMFTAYVFIATREPEKLFFELKKIPKLSLLLGREEHVFCGVAKEEQEFLENIQDSSHVVRRSLIEVDENGQIFRASGAVGRYMKQIVRQRLRKRYVLIEQELLGEKRKIILGVKLKNEE